MARGKYATRSENRRTAWSNELLQEKQNEIVSLQRQLDELMIRLESEQRERGSIIVQRVAEQSAREIALAQAEILKLKRQQKEFNRKIADALINVVEVNPKMFTWNRDGTTEDVFDILNWLSDTNDEYSKYEARISKDYTRDRRRLTPKKARSRLSRYQDQDIRREW